MRTSTRWQLTQRDISILEWMGRWRAVTAPQVRREFLRRDLSSRMHLRKAEQRLQALREMGLIRYRRVFADSPGIHWLSRQGARYLQLHGTLAPPQIAEIQHDLAVVDLAHHLQELQPEHRLVTERETRRLEPNPAAGPAAGLRSDVELGAGRGTGGRAFPDLVTVSRGGEVAVHELEYTRKGGPRLVRIMLSYIYADHIAAVVYWAPPHLLDGVRAAAEEANDSAAAIGRREKIIVRRWVA